MTRTVILCDACSAEIPASAPRYRVEGHRTPDPVAFDACSGRCIAALAARLPDAVAPPLALSLGTPAR